MSKESSENPIYNTQTSLNRRTWGGEETHHHGKFSLSTSKFSTKAKIAIATSSIFLTLLTLFIIAEILAFKWPWFANSVTGTGLQKCWYFIENIAIAFADNITTMWHQSHIGQFFQSLWQNFSNLTGLPKWANIALATIASIITVGGLVGIAFAIKRCIKSMYDKKLDDGLGGNKKQARRVYNTPGVTASQTQNDAFGIDASVLTNAQPYVRPTSISQNQKDSQGQTKERSCSWLPCLWKKNKKPASSASNYVEEIDGAEANTFDSAPQTKHN